VSLPTTTSTQRCVPGERKLSANCVSGVDDHDVIFSLQFLFFVRIYSSARYFFKLDFSGYL